MKAYKIHPKMRFIPARYHKVIAGAIFVDLIMFGLMQ